MFLLLVEDFYIDYSFTSTKCIAVQTANFDFSVQSVFYRH